jgi:hypothetical protein
MFVLICLLVSQVTKGSKMFGFRNIWTQTGVAPKIKKIDQLRILSESEHFPPFAIGGQFILADEHGFSMVLNSAGIRQLDKLIVRKVNELDIFKMLRYCEPSAFGFNSLLYGSKSVVDKSIRNAVECPENLITMYPNTAGEYFVDQFKVQILKHLVDKTIKNVDLKLSRLSIYSTGGFFLPHIDVDHDISGRYVGTLVVCLPSEHSGGELIIRNDGREKEFNFAPHSNDPSIIQFAAFHKDCEHEVLPVTSGHRVVLTYKILKSSNDQPIKNPHPNPSLTLNPASEITRSGPHVAPPADSLRIRMSGVELTVEDISSHGFGMSISDCVMSRRRRSTSPGAGGYSSKISRW